MAKAKTAKKAKKAKATVPYIRRLVEDEHVHGHLRDAAAGIRNAYGRVSSKRGKAAEDKMLYRNLREVATSIRQATLALRRRPEPKRRGRKLLLLALAGVGAAVVVKTRGRDTEPTGAEEGPPAAASASQQP